MRWMRMAAAMVALTGASSGLAMAQSEAQRQSGQMGPATGNTAGANNGVGTSGSIDRNAGSASSTVAGPQRSGTGINPGSAGAGGTLESDPALGGEKKPQ